MNTKTIWVTSDSHFLHNKNFIWQERGFSNVNEMNEAIIENWNQTVKDEDIVYHLGDVMLGSDFSWAIKNLLKLKGKKYLAFGNHDTDKRIDFYKEHKIFKEINMGYRLKISKRILILSHYPTLVANYEDKVPIFTIHGHTHLKEKFSDIFHAYNVCMDAHNCKPVNLEDILSDIRNYNKNNR